MEFRSFRCPPTLLKGIDTGSVQLLWGYPSLGDARMLGPGTSLNTLWQNPIPPYGSQLGFLLFDAHSACDVDYGDHVHFRLTLTDSLGHTFPPVDSEDFIVSRDPPFDRSVEAVNNPVFDVPGYTVDARKAFRRIYSDPIGPVPAGLTGKGTVQIVADSHRGRIGFPSGITTICECVRPKRRAR
jgi:hypothetical protein